MKAGAQAGAVGRLMAVLQQRGPGVHLLARHLGAAAGVPSDAIRALLTWHVDAGHIVKAGGQRRATYGLPGAAALRCFCCGLDKPEQGGKFIAGTGWACAECVVELEQPGPKRAQRSPEGRPPAESKEPWKPWKLDRKTSEPAQRAEAVELPGVKVTVRATPLGRYEVPNSVPVIGGFASMGIGRYLDGGANA